MALKMSEEMCRLHSLLRFEPTAKRIRADAAGHTVVEQMVEKAKDAFGGGEVPH